MIKTYPFAYAKPIHPARPSQSGAHAAKDEACALERSPPTASVLQVAVYPPAKVLPLPTASQLPVAVAEGAAEVDVAVPVDEAGMLEELEDAGLKAISTLELEEDAARELLK